MKLDSLGFTGTRRGLTPEQRAALYVLLALPFDRYHFGDCIGADEEAFRILKKVRPEAYTIGHIPSDDSKRAFLTYSVEKPRLPYLERNKNIARASVLIVCPGGEKTLRSGTWATYRYAVQNKRRIILIYPEGTIEVEANA